MTTTTTTTTTCGDGDDGGATEVAATRLCRAGGTCTGTGVVVFAAAAADGDGVDGADGSGGPRSLQRYTLAVRPRRWTRTVNGRPSAAISCTRARPPDCRRRVGRAPS